MKTLIAVDHSTYSEQALTRILSESTTEDMAVRLVMVTNSFAPPPIATLFDGSDYFRSAIRFQGEQRLLELAEILKAGNMSVDTELIDTRIPPTIIVLKSALHWKAEAFIAGVHSVLGIKRRLLEKLFKAISLTSHKFIGDPDRGTDRDTAWSRKKAA